jgi:hypothetical protein
MNALVPCQSTYLNDMSLIVIQRCIEIQDEFDKDWMLPEWVVDHG